MLWRVNETDNSIVIFENTSLKLSERFATLLKASQEETFPGVIAMISALGLSNLFIEKVIFKMEGNWLLKSRNETLTGNLKLFHFWLASRELKENEIGEKCLQLFMTKFAREVNLEQFKKYSDQEMMIAFTKCFSHGNNEIAVLFELLEHQDSSFFLVNKR